MKRWSAVCAAFVLSTGCLHPAHVSVDPDVTFAAHQERAGLLIDRMGAGVTGEVVPTAFRWSGDPAFVLRSGGRSIAGLWVVAPASVEVRHTESQDAPVIAAVEPGWDDNAIRLTLRQPDGPTWRTDIFERTEGATLPLTRAAKDVIELRGTFRADVRDAKGEPVGWLRVRMGPYQPASRIYDGILPSTLSRELAVAAAVALSNEIDWIQDHTVDVYRSSPDVGPLQQSIPLGR